MCETSCRTIGLNRLGNSFLALLAALACLAEAGKARAESYPDRPVKIIVPYAAGGSTDAIARLTGQYLTEALGQNFIVENRAGASGVIALESVARAPADGYTLLVTALPQVAILPVTTKVKYDPVADFAPVSNIGSNTYVLTVSASLPVKTPNDLVAYIRNSKEKLSYASGGVATQTNLSMVLFLERTKLDVAAVHLRGGSELLNNIVAGHIPMGFLNAADVVQQAEGGKVRALAVADKARLPQLPNLPTMIESGFKDFVVVTWNGVVAPAQTPRPIVDRLSSVVQKSAKDPKFIEKLAAIGVLPIGNTPEQFAANIIDDIKLWGDVARSVAKPTE